MPGGPPKKVIDAIVKYGEEKKALEQNRQNRKKQDTNSK